MVGGSVHYHSPLGLDCGSALCRYPMDVGTLWLGYENSTGRTSYGCSSSQEK
jgi:hypothetical protein